jgi:hypothetical protein
MPFLYHVKDASSPMRGLKSRSLKASAKSPSTTGVGSGGIGEGATGSSARRLITSYRSAPIVICCEVKSPTYFAHS